MLIFTDGHQYQPQYPAELDYSHPQSRGSVSSIYPVGGAMFDAAKNTLPSTSTFGTAPAYSVDTNGLAIKSNSDGGLIYSDSAFGFNAYTITLLVKLSAIDNPYGGIFAVSNSDTTARTGMQRANTTNDIRVYHNNTTFSVVGTNEATTLTDNKFHIITLAFNGSAGGALRYWRDGQLITDTTHSVAPTAASSPRLILFGERSASASFSSVGSIFAADIKNIYLSDAEVKNMHAGFWRMYYKIHRQIYIAPATGTNWLNRGYWWNQAYGTMAR